MTYVTWASFYEGETDSSYFDIILPRIMDEILLAEGTHQIEIAPALTERIGARSREIADVAREVCGLKDAIHLFFIHTDVGGRGLERRVEQRSSAYCSKLYADCGWDHRLCIALAPRHETEAWVIADPQAVTDALGYGGAAADIGLPPNAATAERLTDPKAVLSEAIRRVRGRRRSVPPDQLFPAIAQRQQIMALRGASSFQDFERGLREALVVLSCLPAKKA